MEVQLKRTQNFDKVRIVRQASQLDLTLIGVARGGGCRGAGAPPSAKCNPELTMWKLL
jgi:hypothetical protein